MPRHAAPVAPERRIAGLVLGGFVVALLVSTMWALGRGEMPAVEAAPTTTTGPPTTTVPTTAPSTPTAAAAATTSTTVPAPTTIGQTTTSTVPLLTLGADHLGPIPLGTPYEEVRAAVVERLGEATEDSGWINAQGDFGTCPGTIVRVVRWGSLRLFFGDGPTEFAEEGEHLYYYSQSTVETDTVIDLTTSEGIGVGSTVSDLEAAYADTFVIDSTIPRGITFSVTAPGPGLLSGTLSSSSPDGQVTSLGGGFGCGA